MDMEREFIGAYIAAYGSTEEQAKMAYKYSDAGYISAVIDAFEIDGKGAFLDD